MCVCVATGHSNRTGSERAGWRSHPGRRRGEGKHPMHQRLSVFVLSHTGIITVLEGSEFIFILPGKERNRGLNHDQKPLIFSRFQGSHDISSRFPCKRNDRISE